MTIPFSSLPPPGGCWDITIYSFVVFGLCSGFLAGLVALFRKKLSKRQYLVLQILFLMFFILYSFEYRDEKHCGGRYSSDYEMRIFPSDFIPF